MARKIVRGGKTTTVKGVRLDLSPGDHKRLEHVATERGLSMTSYVRMILLERLKIDEAKG
jgi:hypothetical protein